MLLLSAGLLTSCVYDPNPGSETGKTDENPQQNPDISGKTDDNPPVIDDEEETPPVVEEEEETPPVIDDEEPDTHGAGDGGHTSTIDDEEVESENQTFQYSLENYTDFTWHDHGPEYAENWTFYHGTSKNPNGSLWGSVDDKYCGVEFTENCYIVSPTLKSWKKTEVHFYFWYSSHQSSRYNADSKKSQLVIDMYDENEVKVGSEEIFIKRTDVPTNNTTGDVKIYLRNTKMTHFVLKFNNYIPNSQGGYSAVLCDAKLKGWDYE